MKTVPLTEAKDKLSALVGEVESTHERVEITRHGHAAAVLIAADDLESLQETLYWLAKPDIAATIAEAQRASAAGDTISGEELRAEFGLPPQ